ETRAPGATTWLALVTTSFGNPDLVAVRRTESCLPTSSAVNAYDVSEAPGIGWPSRSHAIATDGSGVQDGCLATYRVPPMTAVPATSRLPLRVSFVGSAGSVGPPGS